MKKAIEWQEDRFMYERMLNKQGQPQYNRMCMHCKERGELLVGLNTWLTETFATYQDITSPYGSHYGQGIAHRRCNKLMYDAFSEAGALTVMPRLSDT